MNPILQVQECAGPWFSNVAIAIGKKNANDSCSFPLPHSDGSTALLIWLEAIAFRLEAIAIRLEAIAFRLEAFAIRLEAIAFRLEAMAIGLEAIAFRLEAFAIR